MENVENVAFAGLRSYLDKASKTTTFLGLINTHDTLVSRMRDLSVRVRSVSSPGTYVGVLGSTMK